MTQICRGGTSGPASGFPQFLGASAGSIGALFADIPLPLAIALGGLLGFISVDLSTLCASDPPADPGIVSQDILDLQNPLDVVKYAAAASKFYTLFKRYLWPKVCVCTDGLSPSALAAPAFPANPPLINPPVIPTPVTGACYTAQTHVLSTTFQATVGSTRYNELDSLLLGGFPTVTVTGGIAGLPIARLVQSPAPVTYKYTISNVANGNTDHQQGVNMRAYDANNAFISNGVAAISDVVARRTGTLTLPANAKSVQIASEYTSDVYGFNEFDLTLTALCAGSNVALVQQCCPPDPVLTGQLQYIRDMVTLIQRQLAPFAYIDGVAHAALSGSGSFTTARLVGVRIDVASSPAGARQDSSVPPFIFDLGWISILDANGFIEETRLHALHQVWFPRIASDATIVGFSFVPGVTATITELLREPY